MQTRNSIEILLDPKWTELEKISDILMDFFNSPQTNLDLFNTIRMVTTELMENAIRYGYFPDSQSKIHLILKKENDQIIIETKNPIYDTDSECIKNLNSRIKKIREYDNPFNAYIDRLREIYDTNHDNKESGLGLVRIAYEGKSKLNFHIDEKNLLSVTAVYKFQ